MIFSELAPTAIYSGVLVSSRPRNAPPFTVHIKAAGRPHARVLSITHYAHVLNQNGILLYKTITYILLHSGYKQVLDAT